MAYSFGQLEQLWVSAGGSKSMAPVMAAIALAESSGNPTAHNASGASGLWQIMIPTNSTAVPGGAGNVFNPQANAAAAVRILKSQGLGAWTTYTSGAYKKYLPSKSSGGPSLLGDVLQNALGPIADLAPVVTAGNTIGDTASSAASSVGSTVSSATNVGGDIAGTLGNIFSFLTTPAKWLVVLKFVGGAVLVFMGLKALTGAEVPQSVKKAATVAAVA